MNESRTDILIRQAGASDARALWQLAALDSAPAPRTGTDVLVAEVGGRIVAAVAGDRAVADPFRTTGGLVELLRVHARQADAVEPVAERRQTPGLRRALARLAPRALTHA